MCKLLCVCVTLSAVCQSMQLDSVKGDAKQADAKLLHICTLLGLGRPVEFKCCSSKTVASSGEPIRRPITGSRLWVAPNYAV